eukprot:PITA_05696
MTLQHFEKWVIDFLGAIQPQGKKTRVQYIITTMKYFTRWVEAQPMKDCTGVTTAKFLFEYVLTQFGCPKILMSDHGTCFLNEMISTLAEEFQASHQKSTPYHPHANRTLEAFNKVLENAWNKVVAQQKTLGILRIELLSSQAHMNKEFFEALIASLAFDQLPEMTRALLNSVISTPTTVMDTEAMKTEEVVPEIVREVEEVSLEVVEVLVEVPK